MRTTLRGLLCCVFILTLVGCSDSGGTVDVDSQFLESTIETTAVPVFNALGLIIGGGTSSPGSFEGLGGSGCDEFPCDGGGTFEFCFFQGQGEAFESTLSYDTCGVGEEIVHGSINTTAIGSQATVVFNVIFGQAQIVGSINLTTGKCEEILISSLFTSFGGISATTTADLTYCGSEWPDGTMTQSTTTAAGALIFDAIVQSNGLVSITVTDGGGADVATCSGDLSLDTLTCQLTDQGEMVP